MKINCGDIISSSVRKLTFDNCFQIWQLCSVLNYDNCDNFDNSMGLKFQKFEILLTWFHCSNIKGNMTNVNFSNIFEKSCWHQ